MPQDSSTPLASPSTRSGPRLEWWILACGLLALVQISWGGYQLGFGNQGIQIPFLEALHNPRLFANDPMVTETLGSYPSFFFHICAKLLAVFSLPTLYLLLHFFATAGVFASVIYLSRSLIRDPWVALVACILLLAGHHQALAGETLYSAGFTHTWAVFPLSLLALGLFFRGRTVMAFTLAGAIFNLHALEAGHLAIVMGIIALVRLRRVGWKTLALACGLYVLAASPTLFMMIHNPQQFDGQWLQLMKERSGDHSFPSTWWISGSPDIPRFLCIIGLAALALGFWMRPSSRRTVMLFAGSVGVLFVLGTIFTDLIPVSVVIRAQFFRSSRLLMILAIILIAQGCVRAWRLPWGRGAGTHRLARWQIALEMTSAALTALIVALPAMLNLLPVALLIALLVALINSRLSWYGALFAGTGLVVSLLAWQTIEFVIPGLPPAGLWDALSASNGPILGGWGGLLALGGIVAFWMMAVRRMSWVGTLGIGAVGLILAIGSEAMLVPHLVAQRVPTSPWIDVQRQAQAQTPVDAVILTPALQSGFRIYSERAIVGEWRDGTQLYFKGAFGDLWWKTMQIVLPNLYVDPEGKGRPTGKPLEALDDDHILEMAKKYNAQYVVMKWDPARSLDVVYHNDVWGLYRAQISLLKSSVNTVEMTAEDQFLRQTALQNIEKYRKSDAVVEVVDTAGKPLTGSQVKITQTASRFAFGASLGFFEHQPASTGADYIPPVVTQSELTRFTDVFNYSVIAFSGQWRFLEPTRGTPNYSDLDAYVAWCVEHSIRPELHFVSGYMPAWAKGAGAGGDPLKVVQHATALAERYGNKITDWQVIADKYDMEHAKELFAAMRKVLPNARLGIADDVKFWSRGVGAASTQAKAPEIAGLDDLRRLKAAGVKVDYFALEARQPIGLWASAKDVYAVLDAFAAEKVPVHITEFGVPVGEHIEGAVRDGTWTPQVQAEYYERFFTLCFGHPDVEAINVMGMGPETWLDGQGLLDENYQPTPAYDTLLRLITTHWRTAMFTATLAGDGTKFRGFQGTYQVTFDGSDGKSATATFPVEPDSANHVRFIWDQAKGTLTRAETH